MRRPACAGAHRIRLVEHLVVVDGIVCDELSGDIGSTYLPVALPGILFCTHACAHACRVHLFQGGVVVFGDPVNATSAPGSAPRAGITSEEASAARGPDAASPAASGGAAGGGGGYDTFKVNYWTIEGNKLPPWSVDDLRRHVLQALPHDPQARVRMSVRAVPHA